MLQLTYGHQQQFRWRHHDINLLGKTDLKLPIQRSVYRLNGSAPVHFYVESVPEPGGKIYPWGTKTPSVLRLRDLPGHFNIEIPIHDPNLQVGWNQIEIEIANHAREVETLVARFHWHPQPIPLPLDLRNLSHYTSIQEIAQVVDGTFELDSQRNIIRSCTPVGSDILLLLGSPSSSQEATYEVTFAALNQDSGFLGLSDFFAGHVEQSRELGIKPGYATSGLATIDTEGYPQLWIAWGDCLYDKADTWVIHTEKKRKLPIRPGVTYCVRHQIIIQAGLNRGRFRIWKKGNPEPDVWVCQTDNHDLAVHLPRPGQASFGLFQYWGLPTEWSNIYVRALEDTITPTVEQYHSIPIIQ
ncbi:MAG: hypothetical protein F6K19_24315 [Cyanothece sp. SIO1E1]|nr:hypothetical protein [Cyanothece sp. SIO1E1]